MIHILLVADGRSTITRGWLRMLKGLGCRVSLVSTFPCDPPESANLVEILPVGFSSMSGGQVKLSTKQASGAGWKRQMIRAFRPVFLGLRAWLAPLTLRKYQKRFTRIVADLKPDLVHALRIPFEGMLAAVTPKEIPLLVSIWGNDLTLHARTSPLMAAYTRWVLERADGLLADAKRDVQLAKDWGLGEKIPMLVVPGSGGLDLDRISLVIKSGSLPFNLPEARPIVVNPRGFRPGSVQQDTFFKSIPLVLEKVPDAFFICTAMQGQPQAENWVRKLGIQENVLLLPYLLQEELWQVYARSQVYVSLSSHDGTPNTFLEALACGCFPVVGDIASLREWLEDGVNGLLVDPRDHQAAADAIIRAIEEKSMRKTAGKQNDSMIKGRAEIEQIRIMVGNFLSGVQ